MNLIKMTPEDIYFEYARVCAEIDKIEKGMKPEDHFSDAKMRKLAAMRSDAFRLGKELEVNGFTLTSCLECKED